MGGTLDKYNATWSALDDAERCLKEIREYWEDWKDLYWVKKSWFRRVRNYFSYGNPKTVKRAECERMIRQLQQSMRDLEAACILEQDAEFYLERLHFQIAKCRVEMKEIRRDFSRERGEDFSFEVIP